MRTKTSGSAYYRENILWWGERRAGRRRRFGRSGRRGRGIFRWSAGSCVTGSTGAPGGRTSLDILESTKGLHVRLGMNQVPNPACSLMTRPIEDGKILLCSVFTWRIKRRVELKPKPRDMTEKYTTFVKPNPELLTAAEEEKTTHQHWKGNSIEKTHSSLQGKYVHNATPKPAKQLQPSTYNLTTTFWSASASVATKTLTKTLTQSSAAFFQYSWLSVRCLMVSGTKAKAVNNMRRIVLTFCFQRYNTHQLMCSIETMKSLDGTLVCLMKWKLLGSTFMCNYLQNGTSLYVAINLL